MTTALWIVYAISFFVVLWAGADELRGGYYVTLGQVISAILWASIPAVNTIMALHLLHEAASCIVIWRKNRN